MVQSAVHDGAGMEEDNMSPYRTLSAYEGYRFCENGHIWSCWRLRGKGWPSFGTISYQSSEWRMLLPAKDRDGYHYISIRQTGGTIRRRVRVSHLILEAFGFQRPSSLHEACHFPDRSLDNNSIANLRWDTRKGNA